MDLTRLSAALRKNRMWIVIALLALVLVLILFRGGSSENKNADSVGSGEFYRYSELLRKDLEELLTQMSGVGKCTVLITFADGGETVYACDEDLSSAGGDKTSSNRQYVLISSRTEGLVLKVHSPSVSGVAVICEGGDSTRVKNDVTEVLSRTLGISADRISVKKRILQE